MRGQVRLGEEAASTGRPLLQGCPGPFVSISVRSCAALPGGLVRVAEVCSRAAIQPAHLAIPKLLRMERLRPQDLETLR